MMSPRILIASVVGGVLTFVVVLVLSINALAHHYDRVNCTAFGSNSGRVVRFVDYSYFSWACLTPTRDGQWISTENLREF